MATFTTWSALYSSMLDILASGNFTHKEYKVSDRIFTFQTLADVRKHLLFVKQMKEDEEREAAGDEGYGTMYIRNGGRG